MKIYHKITEELLLEVEKINGIYNLQNAKLRGADLQNANLQNANLQNADLHFAKLRGADLQNAKLHFADLQNADLQNAKLHFANLRYATFFNSIKTSFIYQVQDLYYHVFLLENHIKIGCELHTVNEWQNFTDTEINEMNSEALKFWKENKEFLLGRYKK